MHVTLPAQDRVLLSCPVRVPADAARAGEGYWQLTPEDGSPAALAQVAEEDSGRVLLWVVDWLPRGRGRTYEATPLPQGEAESAKGVELCPGSEGAVEVSVNGAHLTTYYYGSDVARPYFYPLVGPYNRSLTRHFPMREDVEGESHDHPHHRSLWVAHGDVNGVDNWSEGKGHGRVAARGEPRLTAGLVLGVLEAENDWLAADGSKVCEESRRVTFYASGRGVRVADFEIRFRASEGEVRFGDTKEGGILSLRVAGTMKGKSAGVITTATGGRGEAEAWGKRAAWCDYSGLVAGDLVGVAIFDHPTNFRHPTYWHVRDYGLMTANPFGLSYFLGDPERDGSLVVPAGDELTFRYRLYCHGGDARGGYVAEQYLNFAFPPQLEVAEER